MNTTNRLYNQDIIDYAKDKEQQVKKLHFRYHQENLGRDNNRDQLMRDYARILYSNSFRSLQGKMQLLGIDPSKSNRNRLTHSLEVSQIARVMADNLNLEDSIVVESAALAHDIGNPPFGHYGEKVLNSLNSKGGFEGNAQALRILRTLEKKSPLYSGLNLNIRTLLAVTKYFNIRSVNPKKFIYKDDYKFMQKQLLAKNLVIDKSIDAEIMDLSDEIAYAAHDLEDALNSDLIKLDEFLHEFSINKQYSLAYESILKISQDARAVAMQASRYNSSEEYAIVLRKELVSKIVNHLTTSITLCNSESSGIKLGFNQTDTQLVAGLKAILFKTILRKKDIQHYELRGEKVIKGLFTVYCDTKYNLDNRLLPVKFRNKKYKLKRNVTDYIASMMDSYAKDEYIRYFGKDNWDRLY